MELFLLKIRKYITRSVFRNTEATALAVQDEFMFENIMENVICVVVIPFC